MRNEPPAKALACMHIYSALHYRRDELNILDSTRTTKLSPRPYSATTT